jgi:hypothetical protein
MKISRRLFITGFGIASYRYLNSGIAVAKNSTRTVDVKNYGATGDGIVDDTIAIQKAIDTKRSVYFPPGTYKVNGLNLHSSCDYYGAGKNSIIKLIQKPYSAPEVANYRSNSAFNLKNVRNVKVRNLKFICPTSKTKNTPATEYANIAIDIQSSSDCRIESCQIEQFSGIAILCQGTSDKERCTNITIDRVKIANWYNAYDGSFPQIWFYRYVHDSTVKNSSLEGGTFGIGFYDAYNGTKIDGQGRDIPGAGVYRCKAINNTVKNQSRYGILLYCTRSVAFADESVGHLIQGNKIDNILGSSSTDERSFGAGIYAVGVKDLVISRNVVSNCNQITNNAALAPGCIGIVGCAGNISIDRNVCSDGKWSNLYMNSINNRQSGRLVVRYNILKNSIRENLFCSNCHNAVFYANKIYSDKTAELSPVSFRSVKNIRFEKNNIIFSSNIDRDALFVYQSNRVKIVNNIISTSNPISINRFQEVSDSIIYDNTYNSANHSSYEVVQFRKGKNNKFFRNIIHKPSGGSKVKHY